MKILKTILYLSLLFVIFSCKPKAETAQNSENSQTLTDGTYCFAFKDEVSKNELKLTILGNNVSGKYYGTIEDAKNNYYSSFDADFVGTKDGGNLVVEVTLQIEGDIQKTSEKWQLSNDSLKMERETYTKLADCKALESNADDENTSSSSNNLTSFGTNPQFSWDIVLGEDKDGNRNSAVNLVFEGKKLNLSSDKLFDGEMAAIVAKEYPSVQIPNKALAACTGYWAGGATILYILPSNENEVTLVKAYLGEEGGKAIIDKKTIVKITDFK